MSTSPTQRTLAECRKRGLVVQVVEHWNQFARRRIDLFGVIDLVCLGPDGILGIQACAGASHAARRTKIANEPKAAAWVKAGGKLAVWSWSKRGERGASKRWQLREELITLADFVAPSEQATVTGAAAPAKVRKRAATVKVETHGPDGWPL